MKRGLSNERKPASSPSIARVAATAVSSENGADQEHEREALHLAVATPNSTSAVIAGDDVRVEIVGSPSRNRPRSPRARTSGAHLFLDAFEDDDVRVGGHPDRQDHPAKPGSVSVTLKMRIAA